MSCGEQICLIHCLSCLFFPPVKCLYSISVACVVCSNAFTVYTLASTCLRIPNQCFSAGVAAYSLSSFVSSALDGSVQTFSLDSSSICDGRVTPSAIVMETQAEKKVTSQGVAVSETGLFIAVSIK